MWRAIVRYLWSGLVISGFATHLRPPDDWSPDERIWPTGPTLAPHPERLVPHVPPDATEQALWDQLAGLPRVR